MVQCGAFQRHPRLVLEDRPMFRIFRTTSAFVLLLSVISDSASARSHRVRANQFDAVNQPAVVMISSSLDPQVLKVKQGTTVEWINNGDCRVVAGSDNSFNSGVLKQGQNFRHTFEKHGRYTYQCRAGEGKAGGQVSGTIVVTR